MNGSFYQNPTFPGLEKNITPKMSARCIANVLASSSEALYMGEPGDDTTVAAIKIRKERIFYESKGNCSSFWKWR